MIPILTPSESAALDRASAERGVTVEALMERAGWAVARAAAGLAGGTYGRRAVVVCGGGNNGGDGLVAGRHLLRWGMAVSAVSVAPLGAFRGAAAVNVRRFLDAGGRWVPFSREAARRETSRSDVVLDALFGTGFHGEPAGEHLGGIVAMNGAPAPVVAVDIPSGVDGESGVVASEAVDADVTVTFGALKPGLVFQPGALHAGLVEVSDIGFPPELVRSDAGLVESGDVAALLPVREGGAHKRAAVAMVVAGSRTMTGAAALVAAAAYRAGAGLVIVGTPRSAMPIVQGLLPEAVFVSLPETEEGAVSEEAWPSLEGRLGDVDALALGPGLGRDPSTSALIRRLVATSPVPLVLDADGLNAFEGRTGDLTARTSEAVLTPHAGEFARLTGVAADEVGEDRLGHARKAAAEFGCAVLLKGPGTVVAEPSGRARVNATGGPALATGGTGDVLTGTIAGLLARGLLPADAAVCAAWLQGMAGDQAGEELGDAATASDVLARLPRAFAALAGTGS